MSTRYFLYIPKIMVFSEDQTKILLARRTGEQDYDGVFTFIGGKTETTDESLLAALKREKDEEIGKDAKVKVCWTMSCYQVLFRKKDGDSAVIPHHAAIFRGGKIALNNEEYSAYKWVPITELDTFEPLIANIRDAVAAGQRFLKVLKDEDFEEI